VVTPETAGTGKLTDWTGRILRHTWDRIPHITIPVRTGRDLGRLVEVAALDQKLKSLGQNSAVEFNQRLLNLMQTNKEM
jgi:serine kinase of HPr protein (carbohydrate metabolism regulator)